MITASQAVSLFFSLYSDVINSSTFRIKPIAFILNSQYIEPFSDVGNKTLIVGQIANNVDATIHVTFNGISQQVQPTHLIVAKSIVDTTTEVSMELFVGYELYAETL